MMTTSWIHKVAPKLTFLHCPKLPWVIVMLQLIFFLCESEIALLFWGLHFRRAPPLYFNDCQLKNVDHFLPLKLRLQPPIILECRVITTLFRATNKQGKFQRNPDFLAGKDESWGCCYSALLKITPMIWAKASGSFTYNYNKSSFCLMSWKIN